ncbi:MAG: hypothetical protein U0457_04940 [Candidatus Sericytochromatia bacterium]
MTKNIAIKKISFLLLALSVTILISCDPIIDTTKPTTKITTAGVTKKDISIKILDSGNKQNISSASVKIIYKGTNESKTTNSEGIAKFSIAKEIEDFSVEVSTDGYLTAFFDAKAIKNNTSNNVISLSIAKVVGTISAKVVSDSGQPIESALVSLNNSAVLTDENGVFKLDIAEITSSMFITISKTGFKPKDITNFNFSKNANLDLGNISLNKREEKKLLLDTSKNPLGNKSDTETINSLSSFSKIASDNGFSFLYGNFFNTSNIDDIDTLILMAPSVEYTNSEIEKIIDFVKIGKKVIVTGEWGGFQYFSANNINNLLAYANLKINPDIIKEKNRTFITKNTDYVISNNLSEHFITKNLKSVSFYSSASIDIINQGLMPLNNNITKIIASTSSEGFRIQNFNKGVTGFAAVSTIGNGKLVLLGDTSIFTDSLSDDLKSDISAYDNKKFIANILNW